MRRKCLGLMGVVVLISATSVWGAWSVDSWIGPNLGDWATGSNWDTGNVPGTPSENQDWAVIDPGVGIGPQVNNWEKNTGGITVRNGSITVVNGAYIGCKAQFFIGQSPGQVGEVTVQTGGTLTMSWASSGNRGSFIGNEGTGTVNNWGTMYSKKEVYIGTQVGSVGVVNMYDGVWNWMTNGQKLCYVGTHGNGTLNMYGGLINAGGTRLDITHSGEYVPGDPNTSTGHVEMMGGTILCKHLYMQVNAQTGDKRGTIHQTGGEFIFDDSNTGLSIARVNQAYNNGWWTTPPRTGLKIDQQEDGVHVTVEPWTEVDLDIYPGADPAELNLNTRSKARTPMTILSSEEYDVNQINIPSLHIEGTDLFAMRLAVIDEDENGDGIPDVKIHFSRRDLILALGLDEMEPGTVVSIAVVGNMLDGSRFYGEEEVVLVGRSD